jgi:hypothetical protein
MGQCITLGGDDSLSLLGKDRVACVLLRRSPPTDDINNCGCTTQDGSNDSSGTCTDDKAERNSCVIVCTAINKGRDKPADEKAENDPHDSRTDRSRHVDTPLILFQLSESLPVFETTAAV